RHLVGGPRGDEDHVGLGRGDLGEERQEVAGAERRPRDAGPVRADLLGDQGVRALEHLGPRVVVGQHVPLLAHLLGVDEARRRRSGLVGREVVAELVLAHLALDGEEVLAEEADDHVVLQPTSAMAMPSKPTMAPTRNGAFSTSISSVALRLATSGLNSESRITVSTLRPMTPPSALTSSTAICVAASISCASSAIGPVCGTTTPSFIGCSPSARRFTNGKPVMAVAAPAPIRPFKMPRRVVSFIAVPSALLPDGIVARPAIPRPRLPVHPDGSCYKRSHRRR